MTKLLLLAALTFASAANAFGQQAANNDWPRFEVFAGYSSEWLETESLAGFDRFAGLRAEQIASNFGVPPAQAEAGFRDAFKSGRNLHGLNISAATYLSRRIGLVADFSYGRSTETRSITNNSIFFEDTSIGKRSSYTFLFGPQMKLRHSRIEPFVHALFGVAKQNNNITLSIHGAGTNPNNISTLRLRDDYTAFAAAFGGGVDVPVSRHITIRAIQVDYLPVFTRQRDAHLTAPTGSGADGNSLGQTTFSAARRDGLRISVGVVFR